MPAVKGFALAPGANPIGRRSTGSIRRAAARSISRRARRSLRHARLGDRCRRQRGCRHPAADIAVPLATYTGWNVYKAQPGELCDRDGSYIPFARTKAEREAAGDPRPSIAERYRTRAAYVARVKAAADELVRERLLLPADAAALCQGGGDERPVLNAQKQKAASSAAFRISRAEKSARIELDHEVRLHLHRVGHLGQRRDARELRGHLVVVDLDVVRHVALGERLRLEHQRQLLRCSPSPRPRRRPCSR